MSINNKNDNLSWYIVAGYIGNELNKNTANFVVVKAEDLNSALLESKNKNEEFSAVSALSEEDLKKYLRMIEEGKKQS